MRMGIGCSFVFLPGEMSRVSAVSVQVVLREQLIEGRGVDSDTQPFVWARAVRKRLAIESAIRDKGNRTQQVQFLPAFFATV